MAEADLVPRFGAELKDAFKPVNAWVGSSTLSESIVEMDER